MFRLRSSRTGAAGSYCDSDVNSLTFPFNEILVQAHFEIHDQD